jgi:small-conductance mechanosensitive channel/CRP-like cAMP-binding protein
LCNRSASLTNQVYAQKVQPMFNHWTGLALFAAAIITLLAVVLWRVSRIRFNRAVILSATAALVGFQLLYWLSGSEQLTPQQAPLAQKVVLALSILLAATAVVELVKWTLIELAVKPKRLRIPHFLLDVMGWTLLAVIALGLSRQVFNLELTGLLISSTVVSAIVGLSLQPILSSFFAGISLQIEAPFAVDDWVEVEGQEGRVVRQNWRTLAIVTRRGETVIIPNGNVAHDKIINYSRPNLVVAHDLFVKVAYAHPPNEVKAVVQDVLTGISGIVSSPAPFVVVESYADFAIEYRIRFWMCDYSRKFELHDLVLARSWYALRRAGMAIPVPIREVNLRQINEDHQRQLIAEQRQQIAAALRPVVLFQELNDAQIGRIAESARLVRYTTGEHLVHQGEAGDSLFVIRTGAVGIYVQGEGGQQVYVAERTAGEFFGEMSLLTGELRSASVIAAQETEVVVIDKAAFTDVLAADPTILDMLLDALDRRRTALQTRLHEANGQTPPAHTSERLALLRRIGSFLGIMPISSRG